ncbi:unnamed protein product, partial [Ectocarpus sp. 12 AP-2014]
SGGGRLWPGERPERRDPPENCCAAVCIRFVFRRLPCIAVRVSASAIVMLLLLLVVVVVGMGFAMKEESVHSFSFRQSSLLLLLHHSTCLGQHRGGRTVDGVFTVAERNGIPFVCAKTQKLAP